MWRQNFKKGDLNLDMLIQVYDTLSYIYDANVADALMDGYAGFKLEFSKQTGRLRYIYKGKDPFLTIIPTNGWIIPSMEAFEIIKNATEPPKYRVIVTDEAAKYASEGKSVFTQYVVDIDKNLKPNDEIMIVDQQDRLAALGKLNLPIQFITAERNGVAVKNKKGNKKYLK
jgi:archaeosine-15-forming tRNA-guanine transglycosylase